MNVVTLCTLQLPPLRPHLVKFITMSNRKDLKAFVRYDGTGRLIPGSLILQREIPKVGDWRQIDAYECCNPINTTTTTTTRPSTTTTTTTSVAPTTTTTTTINP